MNDPNKCAACAKATAAGFKSRCVLIEEDYQRHLKANIKLEREKMELNANIRRIIQARDKERAKVKRLVEAVRKWRAQARENIDAKERIDRAEHIVWEHLNSSNKTKAHYAAEVLLLEVENKSLRNHIAELKNNLGRVTYNLEYSKTADYDDGFIEDAFKR